MRAVIGGSLVGWAKQLLNRPVCLRLMQHAEAADGGRSYDVYVRVRSRPPVAPEARPPIPRSHSISVPMSAARGF